MTLKTGLWFVQGHWKWHHLAYEFLLALHSNYGAILYRLPVIVTYWSKIVKKLYPTCTLVFSAALRGDPSRNLAKIFDADKLE